MIHSNYCWWSLPENVNFWDGGDECDECSRIKGAQDEATYWVREYIRYWRNVEPPFPSLDEIEDRQNQLRCSVLHAVSRELEMALRLPVPVRVENER